MIREAESELHARDLPLLMIKGSGGNLTQLKSEGERIDLVLKIIKLVMLLT